MSEVYMILGMIVTVVFPLNFDCTTAKVFGEHSLLLDS